MVIHKRQLALIEDFNFFDNWSDKYAYLISLGKSLVDFPAGKKDFAHQVKGCQSQVWFLADRCGERVHFQAISDAAIVSGLIAILLRIYNDRKPKDILNTPTDFVQQLQLEQHLSPTRSNGLASMLKTIKSFAGEAV